MRCLLLCLLLSPFAVFATDTTSTWQKILKTFKVTEINPRRVSPAIETKVIRQLQVTDIRSDKNRLGLFTDEYRHPREIVFDGRQSLEKVFSEKLASNKDVGEDVLFVIQDFWMTDITPEPNQLPKEMNHNAFGNAKLTCKVDVFVKEGEKYIPLTRLDTVFSKSKPVDWSADNLIETFLATISKTIADELRSKSYTSRKRLDKESLESHYNKKLANAVVTAVLPKKGVYKTIEEFRKNEPSETDFKIVHSRNEPSVLYLKDEKGDEYITRSAWGVCDGNKMFILQQGQLFPLYNDGNAFYWLGVKDIKQQRIGIPVGLLFGDGWGGFGIETLGTIVKYHLTPYLLNLEKGVAY